MDDASRAAQGMTVRREVLGDAHVDRALAGTTAFSSDWFWRRRLSGSGALTDHAIGQYNCPYLARLF